MPQKKTKPKFASKKTQQKKKLLSSKTMFWIASSLGILIIFLFIGSFLIRKMVIAQIKSHSISTSSVLYASPVLIAKNVNVNSIKLFERLKALGYQAVTEIPSQARQYRNLGKEISIFLGESITSQLQIIPPMLITLTVDAQGMIQKIDKHNETLTNATDIEQAWLEPQILSLLGEESSRSSTPRTLKGFPKSLIDAVLSIEDERFYYHFGIDPWGIIRAISINFRSGSVKQGGSTITQQLAKNLFDDRSRTLSRKIREALYAVLIETAYTKDQILELYLNEIFLGQEGRVAIHGFGEASLSFFNKDPANITLAEAATLAGMIRAPTKYSPRKHPDRASERRKIVLEKMTELGKITKEQEQQALSENIKIRISEKNTRIAPYYVDYIQKQIKDITETQKFDAAQIKVYTSIDLLYQQCAENAIMEGLNKLENTYSGLKKAKPSLQAAMLALNPATGQILAWVGGRDYSKNQFDRISQAKRQPGSTFKPFVYLTALDGNLNTYRVARTTSTLLDEPLTLDVIGSGLWEPKNYDKKYRGEVTLREALSQSLNVPTVNLALKVGIKHIAKTAELFGFGKDLPQVPSLALGAGEVSPLEMARAYSALANGGILMSLSPILGITSALENNKHGLLLYKESLQEQRAASEQAIYVLDNILQSVIEQGTGQVVRRLGFKRPCAGKTGTTNDQRDSWFAGFTPHLLAVVWVGFDDNRQTHLTGAQGAAPIWAEFMKCTSPLEPELDFIPPQGVVFARVDADTGLLATENCPNNRIIEEVFVQGTEPVTECTVHKPQEQEERDIEPALPPYLPNDETPQYNENSQLPPARTKKNAPSLPRKQPQRERQSLWDQIWDW